MLCYAGNMKAVSAMFMHLRPNCKDEYLSGELEADADEALVRFYDFCS
jgi:hypothetical protein